MTMSASSPGPNKRMAEFVLKLGHYAHLVLAVGVAAAVVLGAAKLVVHGTYGTVIGAINSVASIVVVAAIVCSWIHERQICLLDVAETPLANPDEAIRKNMRKLRAAHGLRSILTVFAVFLAVSAAVIAVGLANPAVKEHIWFKVIPQVITDFLMVYIAWRFFAVAVHSRLRPWCPFCRWGRGDDGDDDPDPGPDPTDPEIKIANDKFVKLT